MREGAEPGCGLGQGAWSLNSQPPRAAPGRGAEQGPARPPRAQETPPGLRAVPWGPAGSTRPGPRLLEVLGAAPPPEGRPRDFPRPCVQMAHCPRSLHHWTEVSAAKVTPSPAPQTKAQPCGFPAPTPAAWGMRLRAPPLLGPCTPTPPARQGPPAPGPGRPRGWPLPPWGQEGVPKKHVGRCWDEGTPQGTPFLHSTEAWGP